MRRYGVLRKREWAKIQEVAQWLNTSYTRVLDWVFKGLVAFRKGEFNPLTLIHIPSVIDLIVSYNPHVPPKMLKSELSQSLTVPALFDSQQVCKLLGCSPDALRQKPLYKIKLPGSNRNYYLPSQVRSLRNEIYAEALRITREE